MKGQKIRLGILFSYEETWIGGSYYLLNLISALKQVDENKRPEITVFAASEADLGPVLELDYPGIELKVLLEHNPGKLLSLGNRLSSKIFRRPLVQPPAIEKTLDIVYPARTRARFRNVPHKLFWIPDFQEEHLPEMFGQQRVDNRRRVRGRIASQARHIVFSSQDAAKDFKRFYPDSGAEVHVLNFAVTHPDLSTVDLGRVRKNFELEDKPFFLVSNQFWKHKNHKLVLEALRIIGSGEFGQQVLVCFTGSVIDTRNPGYFGEVKQLVEEYGLQHQTRFLGFVDRLHQLALMKCAIAVIQPSLFEGWSTVIEDAKALGTPVIASDLAVHQEQLGREGSYFVRNSAEDLAERIRSFLHNAPLVRHTDSAYAKTVQAFGGQFVAILERVLETDGAKGPATPARQVGGKFRE